MVRRVSSGLEQIPVIDFHGKRSLGLLGRGRGAGAIRRGGGGSRETSYSHCIAWEGEKGRLA